MFLAAWLRPPRRTLTLFVCLMAALGIALGWLAWQVLRRDRLLERSQAQERLEQAADRTVAALHRQVDGLARLAASSPDAGQPTIPDDTVVVRLDRAGVTAIPAGRLLFLPGQPQDDGEALPALAEAEVAEFQRADPQAASVLYLKLARAPSPAVRAAALVGLGRCLRKAGRHGEALDAYDALARIDGATVAGRPAELAAIEGRCSALSATGRTSDLRQEAERLDSALWTGRWSLPRPVWEFQVDQARRWGARRQPDASQQARLALSAAADAAIRRVLGEQRIAGQLSLLVDADPALVVWAGAAGVTGRRIVVAGRAFVRGAWTQATAGQRVVGSLADGGRQVVVGRALAADTPRAVRAMDTTGLPWSLALASADPAAEQALFASRRRLLMTTFGVLGAVLLAGSFFILRSIQRERDVARLQSDFVSAVSHEFRTPLTSLRQLSEMLSKGRVPTDALRQESYEILSRETERLQRLVESILDFGRIEAGSYQYMLAALDAATLVREVVSEIETGTAVAGFTFEVTSPPAGLPVNADRAALALALRNLIENAVKYSGDSRTVWVEASRAGARVLIAVTDRGAGIPESEQRAIYGKFVRGAGARRAGIPGTGIGLTIAGQIVAAHRGQIRLRSAPGAGSTFTLDLPAGDSGGGDSG
jgi:signal transduction histidine kinase